MNNFSDTIVLSQEILDLMQLRDGLGQAIVKTQEMIDYYRKNADEFMAAYKFATDGNNEEYLEWNIKLEAEYKVNVEAKKRLEETFDTMQGRIAKLTS